MKPALIPIKLEKPRTFVVIEILCTLFHFKLSEKQGLAQKISSANNLLARQLILFLGSANFSLGTPLPRPLIGSVAILPRGCQKDMTPKRC